MIMLHLSQWDMRQWHVTQTERRDWSKVYRVISTPNIPNSPQTPQSWTEKHRLLIIIIVIMYNFYITLFSALHRLTALYNNNILRCSRSVHRQKYFHVVCNGQYWSWIMKHFAKFLKSNYDCSKKKRRQNRCELIVTSDLSSYVRAINSSDNSRIARGCNQYSGDAPCPTLGVFFDPGTASWPVVWFTWGDGGWLIGRASDTRCKDPRFEPRQEHNK